MTVDPKRWDIFARVIDNFGDAGVAWRLARQLVAEHNLRVTLWLDDITPLEKIAPGVSAQEAVQCADGVRIVSWRTPVEAIEPAAVVVEAFGCGVAPMYLDRAAARQPTPRWFVLEYLSAEA